MKLQVNQSYQAENGDKVRINTVENGCFKGERERGEKVIPGEWLANGQYYLPPGVEEVAAPEDLDLISIWGEEPPVPETRVSRETAEIISKGLEGIVARFNMEFNSWMANTGCRANFEWRYDGQEIKQLAIKDIDAMIYRKPVPNWQKKDQAT